MRIINAIGSFSLLILYFQLTLFINFFFWFNKIFSSFFVADVKDSPLLEDPLHPPTIATGDGDLSQHSVPLPVFLEEPTNSYVVKNKAAELKCRALHALQVRLLKIFGL